MPPEADLSGQDEYQRGVELYRQGRFEEAAECLARLGDSAGVVGTVAQFYQGMAHRAIGVAALKEGRFALAERHLLAAAKAAGPDAELAKHLASVYARTGRTRQCAAEMEKVSSAQDTPSTARRLAQAQWQAGQREQALMTLTAALRRFGDVAQLHIQVGLFTAASEEYEKAKASFMAAVEADCDNCDAHYYVGLTCSAVGDVAGAVRSFQRAFDLQPDKIMLAYQLAIAAQAAEDSGQSVAIHVPEPRQREAASEILHMAAYVAAEPDFVESFLSLPPSDIDDDLFETLGNIVKTALVDHPSFADLHLYAGRICERLGQYEEAIERTRQALAINPSYVQALVHLGRLFAHTGRARQAIDHLIRATKCGGDWPEIRQLIGELMMGSERQLEAEEHFRRALELNPEYSPAKEAILKLAA